MNDRSPHLYTPPATLFGPERLSPSRYCFRLWAPSLARARLAPSLLLDDQPPLPMQTGESATSAGWFRVEAQCEPGARYRFRIPALGDRPELDVPDPASRWQDGDVHDASVVPLESDYVWRNVEWSGRPWHETVLYELHVGLMGGYRGVMERLPAIAELGFTAIELMPIGDFPGERNWGYDVVLPFAPDTAYGTHNDLRELVDTAHGLGLQVFLDVVYNHFGPDGNYLHAYADDFFREDQHTPWGAAIDFRQPMVRRYYSENTLYWLTQFRFDGLRFDAVHQISESEWLIEMAATIRANISPDRHVHLVLENDDNDASLLGHDIDAQWNDDVHHVMHVLLTGEEEGYYANYTENATQRLARALSEGFVYQGELTADGVPRGTPSKHLPATAFVNFLQNHDQIGNRAMGDRLTKLANPDALRAATALLLLAPQIPMVFMGDESGSTTPFLYFASHEGELAELVRDGRRKEFAHFATFADPAVREKIPDPNTPGTYDASRVPVEAGGQTESARAQAWRDFYREVLSVRWLALFDRLHGAVSLGAHAIGPKAIYAAWRLGDGSVLTLSCNLSGAPVKARVAGECLYALPAQADVALRGGELPGYSLVALLIASPDLP